MRGIKPMKLSFVTRPFSWGASHHLGVGVLAYFPLDAPPTLLTEMEMWTEVMEILGEVAPDLGIPKSRSEFLVVGSAHQPNGEPGPVRHVRVQVGALEKSLYVIGDRHWQKGVPTEPSPFVSMPLTWERAFGGEGFPTNPVGRGFAPSKGEDGKELWPLPNIEQPGKMITSERHRPEPAGLGPIDFTWPQRFSLAGTYDQQWLETRFPGFAADMDWRIWNLAPPDQQQEQPFRGDEEVVLEHLHPTIPVMKGALPGLRAVCYVSQRTPEGLLFAEVPLKLTTIWLFPEIKRGVAVYHGAHPVAEDDADDVEAIMVAAERLSEPPRGEAHYRDVFARRTGEKRAFESLKERDLVPADLESVAPVEEQLAKTKHAALRMKRLRRAADARIANARADLEARGLDPDQHGPSPLPPPPEEPRLEEMGEAIQKMMEESARLKEKAQEEDAQALERLKRFCAETGTDYETIVEEMRSPPRGPPDFTADGQRDKMRALADELSAAGTPVAELEHWATDDEVYAQWKRAEEQGQEAYRMSAHLQPPAFAAAGDVSAARREAVERAVRAGESLARWDLTGVDLSGASLAGANLERALLESVNLSGATLEGANLREAVLAHGDLRGAILEGADLTNANLGGANLESARLSRATLAGCTLTGVSLKRAQLSEAVLDDASFSEGKLEEVDFSRASLDSALFHQMKFEKVSFAGADLAWATFIECDLSGLDFAGSRLEDATLVDCQADGARFAGVSARCLRMVGQVSARGADFKGAKLDESTLRGVCLAEADFSGASLDRADLSKADLTEAKLYRAVARRSMWIRAKLVNAMMVSIDLFEAIVEKADLRGADLRGSNLYGADFALIRSDGKTTVEDAIQDRVRTLPLREEP